MDEVNGTLKRTVWRFAQCEYDELLGRFWVGGEEKRLHPKTQGVLLALLKATGHRLTRKELLTKVWGSPDAVEQPLSNAIFNLRTAISPDPGSRDAVIRTLHGAGFRILVPVESRLVEETTQAGISFSKGDSVAGKRDWKLDVPLDHPLDPTSPHHVWIAQRPTTRETHVFRLAAEDAERERLKAEIDIYNRLKRLAGSYPGFVQVFDWRLTTKPYFLETEYGGQTMLEWAEAQRVKPGLQRDVCLQILIDLSEAVAVMHDCGVVHKALRPSDILIAPPDGSCSRWQVKLANFKSARIFREEVELSEPVEIFVEESRAIETEDAANQSAVRSERQPTTPWKQSTSGGNGSYSGSSTRNGASVSDGASAIYRAPEIGSGALPTPASDIYALGILTFQLLCGDFHRTLTPEWEEFIDDVTLRHDIAEATHSDPRRRLPSARGFAERLRTLEERRLREREHREQMLALQQRLETSERQLTARNARRPWMAAAFGLLLAGICSSTWFYLRAVRDRELMRNQNVTLSAMNDFLSIDLLSRSNPLIRVNRGSNGGSETLLDAIRKALPQVEKRFRDAPAVAGGLHMILGGAFDARTEFSSAEQEFARAAEDLRQAEGPLSESAITAELRRDNVALRTQTPAGVAEASADLQREQSLINRLPNVSPTLQAWLAMARSGKEVFGPHPELAIPILNAAVERAQETPNFNPALLTALRLRFAGVYLRLNDGPDAERVSRQTISGISALHGPDSPETFQARMFLEQALYLQDHVRDVEQQSSLDYDLFLKDLGAQNQLTMSALFMRAQAETSLGEYEPAIRDSMTINNRERTVPNGAYWQESSLTSAALAECHANQFAAGLAHAREVINESVSSATPQPLFTNFGRFAAAECLLSREETAGGQAGGKALNEVDQLLSKTDSQLVSRTAGLTDFEGPFELARARLALLRGQTDLANSLIQKAAPFLEKASSDAYERQTLERIRKLLPRN